MGLEVVRADSVRAAASMLAGGTGARFVAGGTLVVRDINAGDVSINRLVLSDGLGLDGISVDNGRAEVGATVSMATIAAHPQLEFLWPVANSIGGPAVRAMATVGGNLFAPYPFGDFAVALLALGAEAAVEDSAGSATVDLEALLAARTARPGRIVRNVSFLLPSAGSFRFTKVVRRKPHGASVLSIAAVTPLVDGRVKGARVAYGAMAETPMRSPVVERVLEGKPLESHSIAAAAAVATEGCSPMSDPQASDWYRRAVLPVHLTRLLQG